MGPEDYEALSWLKSKLENEVGQPKFAWEASLKIESLLMRRG